MKNSENLLLAFFVMISLALSAQQTMPSSHYMLDPYHINPAYAGFDKTLVATVNYRSQWTPIQGQPKGFYGHVHLPVYYLDGGVGLKFFNYNQGPEQNTGVQASYNYVFNTSGFLFSGGAMIGLLQKRFQSDQIITPEGEYIFSNNHNDPILSSDNFNLLGAMYSFSGFMQWNDLKGGINIGNFPKSRSINSDLNYKISNRVDFFLQYSFYLSDEVELTPSILFISDLQYLQTDISGIINYGNIFGGINLRGYSGNSFESIGWIAGIEFNNHYTLAYSYDLGLSALQTVIEGSHEITIKYSLNRILNTGLPPRIIHNPRHL